MTFCSAWLIPGVAAFAISYLCLKTTNMGINLWLPTYASDELHFAPSEKTLITTLYEVGTISGCVMLGVASDLLFGRRTPVIVVAFLLATVGHAMLIFFGENNKIELFIVIFFIGAFVGGASNMITTTAATDLGKQDILKNNEKALGTVSGIIDGTGSLGAALG